MGPKVYPVMQGDHVMTDQIPRLRELEDLPADPLRRIIKIGQTQHGALGSEPLIPQHPLVVSPETDQSTAFERIGGLSDVDQVFQSHVQPPRYGGDVGSLGIPLDRVWRPVDPSRIVPFRGIIHVRVVVQLPDFISEVDERYPSRGEDDGMAQEDPLECAIFPRLETSKGSGGTRDTTVAGTRVVLERDASSERAWMAIDEESVKESTMIVAFFAQLESVLIGERPYGTLVLFIITDMIRDD